MRLFPILILLIALPLISGCTQPFSPTNDQLKDLCYFEVAQSASRVEVCAKIQNSALKTACFQRIGPSSGDISLLKYCDVDTPNLLGLNVKSGCYAEFAMNMKNISICDGLQNASEKDLCYYAASSGFESTSICDTLSPEFKESCLSHKAWQLGDWQICNQITTGNKNNCFSSVAINLSDPSICDYIVSGYNIYAVRDFCLQSIGIETKNISVCEKIQATGEKLRCEINVSVENGDYLFCDSVAVEAYDDICFEAAAQASGKIDYCDRITNGKEQCYMKMAVKTKDPAICEKIVGENIPLSRDFCIADVSLAKNDLALCTKLKDGTERDKCLIGLAKINVNPEICEMVSFLRKDNCFKVAVIQASNESVCEGFPAEKSRCLFAVAKNTQDPSVCDKI